MSQAEFFQISGKSCGRMLTRDPTREPVDGDDDVVSIATTEPFMCNDFPEDDVPDGYAFEFDTLDESPPPPPTQVELVKPSQPVDTPAERVKPLKPLLLPANTEIGDLVIVGGFDGTVARLDRIDGDLLAYILYDDGDVEHIPICEKN